MSEFKNSISKETDIQPLFELPADLIDLFRALVVQTGNVDLKLRGDGYQAKLIPEILNFISVKELSFTSNSIKSEYKAKKYFIWGFEEPENSYEYKNAQLLANKFKDVFCKNAQIFISTHSFNFLGLRDENINFYRVWKDEFTKSSKISKLKIDNNGKLKFENTHSSEWEILQEELGFFYLNEELQNIYLEKQKQLVQILEIQKSLNKPIIYSEGHNYKYLEKAKSYFYTDSELEIKDCGGKTELQKICKLFSKTNFNKCKVVFVFDCDAESEYKDCMLHKTNFVIPYLLKKNSNNTIPELQKGIENMFNDDVINEIEESKIFDVTETTRNGIMLSRNRNLRKIEFEKIINEERNKIEDYENFEDLFLKMKEI